MEKTFIQNCKLLKKHYTKFTETDTTTAQSSSCFANKSKTKNATSSTINKANTILFLDKLDKLDNIDFQDIKKNALLNYADSIEQFHFKENNERECCNKDQIKWNDDLFTTSLPYPKKNAEFIKSEKKKFDSHNKDIDMLLSKELFKKYDLLLGQSSRKNIKSNNAEQIDNSAIKSLPKSTIKKVEIINNKENPIEINIKQIPELTIKPHQPKSIDTMFEVKKINFDEDDSKMLEFDDQTIRNNNIVKKSFQKWKTYKRKTENFKIVNRHNSKIDLFLENLQKYQKTNILESQMKSKSCISLADENKPQIKENQKSTPCLDDKISSYAHRFKAQKSIIEMQKEKLEEQNRLIEDLKLNKIQKQARESLDAAQDEYRKSLTSSGKYKYKLKNNPDKDKQESKEDKEINPSLSLTKAPRILQQMEERAIERYEKRLLIKERKKLIEEEKRQQAEETVKRKQKEQLLERQERAILIRKQREEVRQLEIRKQFDKKQYIELNKIAIAFHKKKLKRNSFKHFRMIIYNIRIKIEIGKRFYENNIQIKCFQFWKNITKDLIKQKCNIAEQLCKHHLLKNTLKTWKMYQLDARRNYQVATDRYDMSLQIYVFTAWHRLTCEYHIQYNINCRKADKHYLKFLLYQCFHSWRSLPAVMQIERVQNERKRKWRLRVAEILSDYDPLKFYKE